MKKLLHERLRDFIKNGGGDCSDLQKAVCIETPVKDNCPWCSSKALNNIADEIERCYIPRPRFENGEPVNGGDETEYGKVLFVAVFDNDDWHVIHESGIQLKKEDAERFNNGFVKRPTPKVYDADGVEIKVGDTLYYCDAKRIDQKAGKVAFIGSSYSRDEIKFEGETVYHASKYFTHERPVFDAEGEMICKGDTVWTVHTANKFTVHGFTDDGAVIVRFGEDADDLTTYAPHGLIHHEPDSLERIKADRELTICEYNAKYLDAVSIGMDDHLLNRAIALIERGA